jgi:ubiquinone/menaquinone biosynthesis C-methylase UbiE
VENHHPEISEDRLFFFEREEVVVNDFDAAGFILDIGGGGEGVIGKLKGKQVIAIDANRRELEEAAAGPLKIVMDAANLQFLDETFNTATSFYTLMYIREVGTHRRVFGEVYRVLTSGGRFLVWDAVLPPRFDEEKDVAVFRLTVKLPEEEVDAGYGTLWPEEGRDVSYYVEMAQSAGFEVVLQREQGQRFFLELHKP